MQWVTVSMQPGNNYRAAASCVGDVFSASAPDTPQAAQTDADAKYYNHTSTWSGYEVPAVWSKMLTVWRKLWIERDTMLAPDPTELRFVGPILAIYPTSGRPGLTTVQTTFPMSFNGDLNNYEEGTITFTNCLSGADTFPVVESYPGSDFGPSKLILLGTPGPCAAVDTGFTLYDDDGLSALGTPSNPRFPDGGNLLTSAFKPAYILPVYAGTAYQDVVPFEDYLNAYEIEYGQGSWDDGQDLTSSSDLWAWFVVAVWEGSDDPFEGQRNGDGDPDYCFTLFNPPIPREGAESPVTGTTDVDDKTSVIFFQAVADDAGCLDQTDEAHNVVHEIGHAHSGHDDGGIMEKGAPKNQDDFTSQSLKKFRTTGVW